MESLLKVADRLDGLARRAGKAAGWLILLLILVIMFDVLTRKLDATRLFFAGITAEQGVSVSTVLQDFQWHIHGVLLMLTFGFGYLANAHVRVDIFREMLSRRAQAWLELILMVLLGLPFLAMMILYSWDLAYISYTQGEGSESLTGIGTRWVIKTCMLIGFVLLACAALATIIRLVATLWGSLEQREKAMRDLAIFSDASDELEKARLEAERLIEEERRALEK